jgi:hypothetical protein
MAVAIPGITAPVVVAYPASAPTHCTCDCPVRGSVKTSA